MSMILLYPKLQCEVGCAYCFGAPTKKIKYDKEKMIDTLKNIIKEEGASNKNAHKSVVCLHGGEIFKLPVEDFEYFVKESRNLGLKPSLMTSTLGLTDEHIRLIKFYNIGVGISLDGPPEFNILRGPRDPEKNKQFQQDVLNNIKKLKDSEIEFGSIAVLSRANASPEKVDTLIDWVKTNKIQGRFNAMFSPNYNPPTKNLVLTASEVKNVWIKLADVALETNLNILPIREFIDNLLGYPFGPCWTSRCDYMTTIVKMILPDGEIGPCDRCLQDGVRCRSLNPISLRSENLRNTDCKGCRYFEICGGGCPGETIDSDIRNKTKGCEAIYGVYSYLENRLRSMFPKIYLPGVDEPDWYNKSRNSKRDPSLWNKNMTFSVWRNGGQKRD